MSAPGRPLPAVPGRGVAPPGTPGEVARYFFRLGAIAFGGPAAHVALMRRDLVRDRRWVTDEQFADFLGAANLIPGPNSTEMTMHLGAARAGWRGLAVGGACFLVPAVAIVLLLAWAYVRFGETAGGEALVLGLQPVMLAVVVEAVWGLRRGVTKTPGTLVAGALAGLAWSLGAGEVVAILGAGVVLVAYSLGRRMVARIRASSAWAVLPLLQARGEDVPLSDIFFVFLKIGALLYGSGYVLIAFLETEFVERRSWLTPEELVDAVAAGQFTPGPLFSTATFVGYLLGSWEGAALATAGIFLPSFVFVALTRPFIPRLRGSAWAAPFLDGVSAASVVLMGLVSISLGGSVLGDAGKAGLFVLTAAWMLWRDPKTVSLVGLGIGAGLLRWTIGWT